MLVTTLFHTLKVFCSHVFCNVKIIYFLRPIDGHIQVHVFTKTIYIHWRGWAIQVPCLLVMVFIVKRSIRGPELLLRVIDVTLFWPEVDFAQEHRQQTRVAWNSFLNFAVNKLIFILFNIFVLHIYFLAYQRRMTLSFVLYSQVFNRYPNNNCTLHMKAEHTQKQ